MKRKLQHFGAVKLDHRRQIVTVDGRETSLQYKAWRVLTALIEAAPEIVSRTVLIEEIWQGNYATGERGLTHALWTIRSALNDETRAPTYIKTIPRTGYQWIGPEPKSSVLTRLQTVRPQRKVWATAAVLAISLVSMSTLPNVHQLAIHNEIAIPSMAAQMIKASNGTSASFAGADIIVRHFEGCIFTLRPELNTSFSRPVFSSNGEQIAFEVSKPEGCKLVVFEFETRSRQYFGACPSKLIEPFPATQKT